MTSTVEAALRRHRAFSIAALAALTLLAWAWLFMGAGMGMDPLFSLAPAAGAPSSTAAPMPPMADMPGMEGMDMSGMAGSAAPASASLAYWSPAQFALTVSMWWIMMVAMMLPSAAPTILLYALVARKSPSAQPATGAFLVGYLAVWALFSLLATTLQMSLERIALLAPMLMASQSRWLSAAVLITAGLYQLSPLKDVCLRQCRNPAQFLSTHYRPAATGAFRMGLIHGAYCVGGCWLLMALLFVGGIMNLAWIALLTLMVAAEKLLPHGRLLAYATGLGCIGWGMILALSAHA